MNMRRCFSWLLLACVCLSALFLNSTTAYANIDNDDYTNESLTFETYRYINGRWDLVHQNHDFVNGDSGHGWYEGHNCLFWTSDMQTRTRVNIGLDEFRSKMLSKGSNINFSLNGFKNYLLLYKHSDIYTNVATLYFDPNGITQFYVRFLDSSKVWHSYRLTNYSISGSGSNLNISFNYDSLPFDVYGVSFEMYHNVGSYKNGSNTYDNYSGSDLYGFDLVHGSDWAILNIDEIDANAGILETVGHYIQNIFEGILNLPTYISAALSEFFANIETALYYLPSNLKGFFDNIVNGVSSMSTAISNKLQSVMTGIQNSLTTLCNNLLNGIKSLFIPSEQSIKDIREDWEQLLAIRFGALYEVVDLIIDYASAFNSTASVNSVSSSGSITFPVVSIPLGSVNFDFGGWEVDLIPDGFEFLIDSLKLIISVSATILFVNSLKNKFERLVTR